MNLVNQLQFQVSQVFPRLCSKILRVIMCFTKWWTGSILACEPLSLSWTAPFTPDHDVLTCHQWNSLRTGANLQKNQTKLMKNSSEYITFGLFLIAYMSKNDKQSITFMFDTAIQILMDQGLYKDTSGSCLSYTTFSQIDQTRPCLPPHLQKLPGFS